MIHLIKRLASKRTRDFGYFTFRNYNNVLGTKKIQFSYYYNLSTDFEFFFVETMQTLK